MYYFHWRKLGDGSMSALSTKSIKGQKWTKMVIFMQLHWACTVCDSGQPELCFMLDGALVNPRGGVNAVAAHVALNCICCNYHRVYETASSE